MTNHLHMLCDLTKDGDYVALKREDEERKEGWNDVRNPEAKAETPRISQVGYTPIFFCSLCPQRYFVPHSQSSGAAVIAMGIVEYGHR